MPNELVKLSADTMSKLALHGDVAGLTQPEKVLYYTSLCQRVGLDPATQPFKLMKLNGKEVFYLDRSGAQQLNRVHQISHEIKSRDFVNGCYVVTARASIGSRFTDSLGSVAAEGLRGEAFANATMKAETKAKRRATLDLVGLGMLDEMEVETIPNAQKIDVPAVPMPIQPQNASQTAPERKTAIPEGESFEAARPKQPEIKLNTPEAGDLPESIGKVDAVTYKNIVSKKNGKNYQMATIRVNESDFTTFDETMAIGAENAKTNGHSVRIFYAEEVKGRFTNKVIKFLTVLDGDIVP